MTRQLNIDSSGFDFESPVYRFGPLETQANNCLPSPIIYGEVKAAGNKIWQSSGETRFDTIVCFADGEISSFSEIKINDNDISTLSPACPFLPYVGNGTQQIDSRVPGDTNADKAAVVGGLKHNAYLALSISAGSKVSKNYFNVTAKIKGKLIKVYRQTPGSYTTSLTGSNNDLTFTDLTYKTSEGVSIEYRKPTSPNQLLAVSINSDNTILVNLSTDSSNNISSTANDIKQALEQNSNINSKITVTFAPGNDGTGKVTVLPKTKIAYDITYSNNPAWCILDFLTCYNGCGLTVDKIDIQSFIDAAAYCDEKINPVNATGTVSVTSGSSTVTGSGTKFKTEVKVGDQITVNSINKIVTAISSDTSLTVDSNFVSSKTNQIMVIRDTRFTLNIILDQRKRRLDWLNDMFVCCRANLVYNSSGLLALKIEQDAYPSQSFMNDDIIAESEVFWTSPKEKTCDILKVQYIDPSKDYTRIYAPAESDTFLNDPPLIQEIRAYGVTSFKQASRLAWFYLNQAKTCNKFISFKTTKKALDRSPGDVIQVTSTVLNYVDKKMRIVRLLEDQDGQIQLICREYNGGSFATLTTNLTGNNNDLTYISKKASTDANNITVSYVNPGQPNQSLNISVTGYDITVNLGTDGSGNINSTSNAVRTAIRNSSNASALVSVDNANGNDGTGIVTATTIMSLSGGVTSGLYLDTLGSVAPTINTVSNNQQTLPNSSATKVVAANNSLNKAGADFVVPDGATNAQNTINDAINAMPLSTEVTGSVASIVLTNQVPAMTSNTGPSGLASASSVNTYTGTNDLIPTMSSNTAPSGIVSASSTLGSSWDAYKAMDKDINSAWITNNTQTGWLQYKFTSAQSISKYTITCISGYPTRAPKSWTLQASDTGSFNGEQVILDTQNNITGWSTNNSQTFTFNNSTAYLYYRLNVTANNGDTGYLEIAEWKLFPSFTYDAWKALNHTNTEQYDCWMSTAAPTSQNPQWLQYQLASAKTIVNYAISSINAADQTLSPKSWKLKGSNNGIDWTILDTQTNITGWTQAQTRNYSLADTTAYSYYKLDITENNGHASNVAVAELSLGQADSFFITSGSSLSDKDDVYNGTTIKFTSGSQKDKEGTITGYTGSTKLIKIEDFKGTNIPSINDTFDIMDYTGKIVLMEGNYICDNSIVLKSGITLEGQGSGTVIKIKDNLNSNIDLIKNSDNTYGNLSCKLSNLSLNGNLLHNSSGTQNAVNFNMVRNSNFDKVFIINFRNLGISLNNCSSITVDSCNITNNDTGIKLISSNYNIINSSISDYNTSSGIYIDVNSSNNSINNCHSSYNEANSGIVNFGSKNNFIGNICNNNKQCGISNQSALNNTIATNTCNNNEQFGILNQAASNNKIATNTCNNNKQHGLYIYNGSNSNDITGNTCIGNGLNTDNTYSNIYVDTNCNYNNIQNNTVRSVASGNKPKYGVRINTSNCNKNIVSNNDMTDANTYGTGAYGDAGTGTVSTNNRTAP